MKASGRGLASEWEEPQERRAGQGRLSATAKTRAALRPGDTRGGLRTRGQKGVQGLPRSLWLLSERTGGEPGGGRGPSGVHRHKPGAW